MPAAYDPNQDYYETLGVRDDSTAAEIAEVYRRFIRNRANHPDHGGDAERFKQVGQAFNCLGDPSERDLYDRLRDEYFDSLPPAIRLSVGVVDFGSVKPGTTHDDIRVQVFNDGGDGDYDLTAKTGSFWSAEWFNPADEEFVELIVTCQVDSGLDPGVIEEETVVMLRGSKISAEPLLIRVDVENVPVASAAGSSTASRSTSSRTFGPAPPVIRRPTLPGTSRPPVPGRTAAPPRRSALWGAVRFVLFIALWYGLPVLIVGSILHFKSDVSSSDLSKAQLGIMFACGVWFFTSPFFISRLLDLVNVPRAGSRRAT